MYTNTHLQKHADTWKNKNTYKKQNKTKQKTPKNKHAYTRQKKKKKK